MHEEVRTMNSYSWRNLQGKWWRTDSCFHFKIFMWRYFLKFHSEERRRLKVNSKCCERFGLWEGMREKRSICSDDKKLMLFKNEKQEHTSRKPINHISFFSCKIQFYSNEWWKLPFFFSGNRVFQKLDEVGNNVKPQVYQLSTKTLGRLIFPKPTGRSSFAEPLNSNFKTEMKLFSKFLQCKSKRSKQVQKCSCMVNKGTWFKPFGKSECSIFSYRS